MLNLERSIQRNLHSNGLLPVNIKRVKLRVLLNTSYVDIGINFKECVSSVMTYLLLRKPEACLKARRARRKLIVLFSLKFLFDKVATVSVLYESVSLSISSKTWIVSQFLLNICRKSGDRIGINQVQMRLSGCSIFPVKRETSSVHI